MSQLADALQDYQKPDQDPFFHAHESIFGQGDTPYGSEVLDLVGKLCTATVNTGGKEVTLAERHPVVFQHGVGQVALMTAVLDRMDDKGIKVPDYVDRDLLLPSMPVWDAAMVAVSEHDVSQARFTAVKPPDSYLAHTQGLFEMGVALGALERPDTATVLAYGARHHASQGANGYGHNDEQVKLLQEAGVDIGRVDASVAWVKFVDVIDFRLRNGIPAGRNYDEAVRYIRDGFEEHIHNMGHGMPHMQRAGFTPRDVFEVTATVHEVLIEPSELSAAYRRVHTQGVTAQAHYAAQRRVI